MMGTEEFVKAAKTAIKRAFTDMTDPTDHGKLKDSDIYFVTCTFVLGNIKGLFSTSIQDGKYYEVTYDANEKIMYVDCYVRLGQTTHDLKNAMSE